MQRTMFCEVYAQLSLLKVIKKVNLTPKVNRTNKFLISLESF